MLELNQSQWLKPYVEFSNNKKNGNRKSSDKNGKAFYKWKIMKSNEKIEITNWCKTRKEKKQRAIYHKNI